MPAITVDGVEYHYLQAGLGPLVVLGHSDASSSRQWRGLMEAMSGDHRLRAFDTSGQGRSGPWPEDRAYSVDAESRVVDALAGASGERVHLVGHSAGGMFVLAAALRLGERLASLTLIEPTTFSLLRHADEARALAEVHEVALRFKERVAEGRTEAAMAGFVDYWAASGAWAATPEGRRIPMLATAPKICRQWDAALDDVHTLADYARLSCPTLLVRGSETTLAARRVVDLLSGALPECAVVEVEGAGHMCPITHGAVVDAHIARHLRRQRDR